MTQFIILILGLSGVTSGRVLFGRWFNHVSLYSAIWSTSLLLFEWRLIDYYPLEPETWLMIVCGWISFVAGSAIVIIARWAVGRSSATVETANSLPGFGPMERERVLLERILWALNIITLLAALHSWYLIVQKFGSITNALLRGALLYSLHTSESIQGTIPYVSSLCLTAALLAGIYTAKVGKAKLAAIVPIIVCIIVDLSNMSRAMMIMAGIIFCSGYFVTRRGRFTAVKIRKRTSNLQRVSMVVVAIGLLVVGIELARSTRHANEEIVGASRALERFQGASFLTPSIYLYLTVHHAVFNQYLKQDAERSFFGANTFAPLYRVLAKLGFDTYVEPYQPAYRTPVWSNTGTYLRELHADFGLLGIFLGPLTLGALASLFWCRFHSKHRYVDLAILSSLQVIAAMSVFYIATRVGYLAVYIVGALVIGTYLDRTLQKTTRI